MTFRDAVVGENAGDEFGTAVTSNGVEFVASAPKFDGAFTDQGKVYFSNVLNPGTALLTFTFVTGTAGVIDASADNHNLGVSLSLTVDRILYMGGNTGPGAYAAEITNIVTPAATKLENFPGTLGGDVSQSRGLAALGYVGSMVELYSDNTNPASPDVTITKQDPLSEPDYARDISISSSGALLMVNGNTNDRAYSYYITSCYKGGTLKANEWTMIGLQCNTSANIGLIFTPDLGTYDTNWVMYRQNGADYEGHQNAYVKMAATEIMIQGHGYWIIKDADKTWTIPTAIGDAATQTPVEADPRAGFFGRDNVAAVQSTDLQTMLAGLTTPAADIRVMFSNPFPTAMDWSLTLFESPPSPARTLTEVAPFFEGSDNSAYVYKTGEGIHNGYLAIAANTPGMPREIAPGEGFFVRFSEGFKIGFLDLNKPVVFLFAQSK
ncbi:hypothetical protein [Methyloprofundus sp.]|uniref:hypothetical protein n=1 Tax=Methyloprofundus sp. TaxID=2020875 RepID=UPI003D09DB10